MKSCSTQATQGESVHLYIRRYVHMCVRPSPLLACDWEAPASPWETLASLWEALASLLEALASLREALSSFWEALSSL